MITELEIYNMALADLGIDAISSLIGTEKEHSAFKIYYAQTLSYVITQLSLPTFKKTDPLSHLATLSVPGFTYIYQYPGDCLRIESIVNFNGDPVDAWDVRRIGDISQTVIVANLESLSAIYIARVLESSLWTTEFVECLRFKLGENIAMYLTQKRELMQLQATRYYESLALGVNRSGLEKSKSMSTKSPFTEAR